MTLYLIAHKVRGAPAFDVAEKVQIGEEEGFIIPTSGHRAYPFWYLPFENLTLKRPYLNEMSIAEMTRTLPMPLELQDHYAVVETRKPVTTKVTQIDLEDLL